MANRCKICKSASVHKTDCPKFFKVVEVACDTCGKVFFT